MKELLAAIVAFSNRASLLQPLALLAGRIYVADVFFRAGWLKLTDWDNTLALFRDEYMVPVLPPHLAAYAGTFGELVFPTLLVFGFLGRVSAAGLFLVNVMAVVSYPLLWTLDCPAGLNSHVYWGSLLAALVVFGPGKLSVDGLISRDGIDGVRPSPIRL